MEAQAKPATQPAVKTLVQPNQTVCPTCHVKLQPSFYFCPNCGRKLKGPPPSVSVATQIGIYALSIFLPPLGLIPGIKYALKPDKKVRTVGIVAIILTILSVLLTFVVMLQVAEAYMKILNQVSSGTYSGSMYGF